MAGWLVKNVSAPTRSAPARSRSWKDRPRARPKKSWPHFRPSAVDFCGSRLAIGAATERARALAMPAEGAAKPYKRDPSGVAPASPQVADRALLERAGSREPADRGGVDGIGPRHIGLRLAFSKALERFLALMGRHLARASEANAALLGSLTTLAGPGGAEGRKCGQLFSVGGQCTFGARRGRRPAVKQARRR